jgi:hypothetical protein
MQNVTSTQNDVMEVKPKRVDSVDSRESVFAGSEYSTALVIPMRTGRR